MSALVATPVVPSRKKAALHPLLSGFWRRQWAAIALLVTLACGLRLLAAFVLRQSLWTTGDVSHDQLAQQLLAGQGFTLSPGAPYAANAPGYATFLALAYGLLGHNWLAVGLSQALLAGVATLLVYRLAQKIFKRSVGITAAALVACNPYTLYQATRIIDTMLFTVVLLAVTGTTIWAYQQRQVWAWAALGLLLGLGCLVRSTMLAVGLACGLWLLLEARPRRTCVSLPAPMSLGAALRAIAICLLVMGLAIAPWTLRNLVVMQRLILIEAKGVHNLYMGNNPLTLEYIQQGRSLDAIWFDPRLATAPPSLPPAAQDHWYLQTLLQFICQQPLAYLQLLGAKGLAFWSIHLNPGPVGELDPRVTASRSLIYTLSYAPLVVLGFGGILLTWGRYRETRLVVLIFACYTLVHILIWSATRLRMPLDALLAIFASYSLVQGWQRLQPWLRAAKP